MILQTMYQNAIKNQVRFFNEFLVLDLLVNKGCAVALWRWRSVLVRSIRSMPSRFSLQRGAMDELGA